MALPFFLCISTTKPKIYFYITIYYKHMSLYYKLAGDVFNYNKAIYNVEIVGHSDEFYEKKNYLIGVLNNISLKLNANEIDEDLKVYSSDLRNAGKLFNDLIEYNDIENGDVENLNELFNLVSTDLEKILKRQTSRRRHTTRGRRHTTRGPRHTTRGPRHTTGGRRHTTRGPRHTKKNRNKVKK